MTNNLLTELTDNLERLCDLKDGQKGIMHSINDEVFATKLISMGMLPGKTIEIIRRNPFGGGIYVKVENMLMALRLVEAEHILLEKFD